MPNQQQNTYAPLDPQSAEIVSDSYWLNKVPEQYRGTVEQQAKANGVPLSTAVKMLTIESHFNPNSISPAGALGIAQVMPATGAQMGYSPQQLMNPETGIGAGMNYLGQMFRRYGVEDRALAAYNMGPGNMDKVLHGKMGMPQESANYIEKAHRLGTMGSGDPQIHSNNDFGNHSDTQSNLNNKVRDTAGTMPDSPFPENANQTFPNNEIGDIGYADDEHTKQVEPMGLSALAMNFNKLDAAKLAQLTKQLES